MCQTPIAVPKEVGKCRGDFYSDQQAKWKRKEKLLKFGNKEISEYSTRRQQAVKKEKSQTIEG